MTLPVAPAQTAHPSPPRVVPEGQALLDGIARLRKSLNAVVLAHYYQDAEIQDLADFVGDSLQLSQAAANHMIPRGRGNIVNISSGAGQLGLPYVAPYGAAKAGVNNLTLTFAGALGRHGIRVNCVAVGAVASEGFVREMHRIGRDPDDVGGRSNGVGRAGRPSEIAYPILFLVSEASSFLSGETIYVGGGPHQPPML